MNLQRKTINNPNSKASQAHTLSVATYNLLADCHIKGFGRERWYPYVSDEHLFTIDGGNRHQLIVQELDFLGADVLMLQEVGTDYAPMLTEYLKGKGYDCHFLQHSHDVAEGLIMAHRREKLQSLETLEVNIYEELTKILKSKGIDESLIVALKPEYPMKSLIKGLRLIPKDEVIITANIHNIFEYFRQPDLQAAHVCIVTQILERMRTTISTNQNIPLDHVHIILGGDFNGNPDHFSIKLMKRKGGLTLEEESKLKHLSYELKNKTVIEKENPEANMLFSHLPEILKNPLQLKSSYETVCGSEPRISASIGWGSASLDYIFSSERLNIVSVLEVGDELVEKFSTGGPTHEFGSDHLPMKVVYSV